MDTISELKELIHTKFDIDPSTLDADTPMASYGIDSLELAEFLFSVEDHFAISFPDTQMKVETLGGLAQMIDEVRAGRPAE